MTRDPYNRAERMLFASAGLGVLVLLAAYGVTASRFVHGISHAGGALPILTQFFYADGVGAGLFVIPLVLLIASLFGRKQISRGFWAVASIFSSLACLTTLLWAAQSVAFCLCGDIP